MNILIVTEKFKIGGLERSILKQIKYLEDNGHNVYLAIREYDNHNLIENRKNILYLPEKMFASAEVLIKFVEKNNINIIHAHPFNTILCSIFASQVTQIPMVYTVHGLSSLNYTHRLEDDILIRYFIGEVQPNIFSVSQYYTKFLKEGYFNEKTTYLPNSIDMDSISLEGRIEVSKGIGVFVGRFSDDNVKALKKFYENKSKYNLSKVDIYGHGNELEKLIELVKLSKGFFEYKGISDNPLKTIEKYEVVLGIGQQVMEGISLKKKVILIGYGKLSGYLNYEIYNQIKVNNFVNRFISNKENLEFNEDDIEFIFEDFSKNYNSTSVNKIYLNTLIDAEFVNNDYIVEIFHMRNSDSLLNLCKEKILPNTLNPYILNSLKWGNNINTGN
ncbi:hypothetical protein CD30_13605 [Ureibacillus massiliensis 4400831 = CIP 108448 = CCUG 49529]|uniref:Glycosyltransferase subfamily 4-like N-terminal domain-containing protein n=1 Tax=Ureibacillus massiliensis 4400831 = CIP 108448 = CCUG 49529 TaxID=1211035 RepID=A0A0A3IZ90_9BACL|nr:glycosyltransferase [Ureibacillus massiliensis]KGR90094.1 hypothetical protein CD30_13605 [Ureibacillus massiliensis 4400831 = CIP 108448 = CCUG 49529]